MDSTTLVRVIAGILFVIVLGVLIYRMKGKTAGYVALRLNGAAGGKAATSISWQFQDVNGASLRSGSVAC